MRPGPSERCSTTLHPHLGPSIPVQQNIGGLEVAVDGLPAVQERHAGADVPDDPPGPVLGQRTIPRPLQHGPQVLGEQLHHEHQAVRPRRDGPVHVDGVGAPQTDHGVELAQERPALAVVLLVVCLPSLEHVVFAEVVGDVKHLLALFVWQQTGEESNVSLSSHGGEL